MTPEKTLMENFKLSLYEARVYLSLIRGSMTPKQVSQEAQVPLPRTYDTLRSLQAKGFVEERGDLFSAISPKAALEMRINQFEEAFLTEQGARKGATEKLVERFGTVVRKPAAPAQDVVLLRGINAIASKFSQVISESEDILLVISRSIDAKQFFKPYLQDRTPKSVRILLPANVPLTREDTKFARKFGFEIRRAENVFLDLMVAGDSTVMIGVPDPASEEAYHSIAVVISSRQFATAVRRSLEGTWSRAR